MRICNCSKCGKEFPTDGRKQKYCSHQCYVKNHFGGTEERFWSRVEKGPDCWLWKGQVSMSGYGKFFYTNGKHIYTTAHRFSYLLHFKESPEAVCHICDVKLCVNPTHLFGGTQLDNVADRHAKGRTFQGPKLNRRGKGMGLRHSSVTCPESVRRGEDNGTSKLTEDQVKEIRKKYVGEYGQLSSLGRDYGVSHTVILYVVNRRTWRHIN